MYSYFRCSFFTVQTNVHLETPRKAVTARTRIAPLYWRDHTGLLSPAVRVKGFHVVRHALIWVSLICNRVSIDHKSLDYALSDRKLNFYSISNGRLSLSRKRDLGKTTALKDDTVCISN